MNIDNFYRKLMKFSFPANTSPMSFSISGNVLSGASVTGTDVSSACGNDWINIPCATNSFRQNQQMYGPESTGPDTCVDRICGMIFNSVTQANVNTAKTRAVNSKYR